MSARTTRYHRPRRNFPAAFSLVELLVVIGVIAVLLGVLLPVVSRSRAAARRTTCAAHLSEIGRAMQSYLNDFGGRLPLLNPLPLASPPAGPGPSLFEVFDRYIPRGSHEVWHCPADHVLAPGSAPDSAETYFAAYGVSYEYNFFVNALWGGQPMSAALAWAKRPPLSLPPEKFRLFNDFTNFHGPKQTNGNMNFLFADWHVGDLP